MVKVSILTENSVSYSLARQCKAEWGFSAYLQIDGLRILFDFGHTDAYIHNAKAMGIDLNNTDFAVLSHHHWDHIGGVKHFNSINNNKIRLFSHKSIIDKADLQSIESIYQDFDLILCNQSIELGHNIYFLTDIPRLFSFESGMYNGEDMKGDSAIAIKTNNGTIILTACSHSGICNICEQAKKLTNQKIYAVIGGFHLFENDIEAIEGTIKYFQKEKPEFLYPMHCVDFPTLCRLNNDLKINKISCGDNIVFN